MRAGARKCAIGSLDPSVDQIEVGLVVRAVLGQLPAAHDRVAVVLEPGGEAVGEGFPFYLRPKEAAGISGRQAQA